MKRTILLWITAVLMLVLAACGGSDATVPAEPSPTAIPSPTVAQTGDQATEATGTEITSYVVTTADSQISGEIHRISGSDPTTVIIVVGGSSARTRADTAVALPLFLGPQTTVAIHDRQGNGASEGRFQPPNTQNTAWLIPALASDVSAIAAHLRAEGFSRIGLVGSSMGSWVNIATAAQSEDVDFIVCLTGTANSVGVSDEFSRLVETGLPIAAAVEAVRSYDGTPGYDPAVDFAAITQPGLWIMGAADESNPTQLDAQVLERLRENGKPFEVMILPDTNHELLNIVTGEFNTLWVGRAQSFIAGVETTP